MRAAYVCQDKMHSGDPLIVDRRDAYEIRLESRRLCDQRDRKNRQLIAVICKACLPFRMAEMVGEKRQQQSALWVEP